MKLAETHHSENRRYHVFRIFYSILFLTLFTFLTKLQIIESEDFEDQERKQGQRRILHPGARGDVFDRDGKLLIGNKAQFSAVIHLDKLKKKLTVDLEVVFAKEWEKGNGASFLSVLNHIKQKQFYLLMVDHIFNDEFYSTIDILLGASSLKELNDFENMLIPAPSYFFEKLSSKKIVKNLKDELSKELIEDLILAESIYQNNFYGENVKFNSGMTKVNRGQCIERELAMMKVSLNS